MSVTLFLTLIHLLAVIINLVRIAVSLPEWVGFHTGLSLKNTLQTTTKGPSTILLISSGETVASTVRLLGFTAAYSPEN